MQNYLALVCVAFVLATFVEVNPCMFRDWKELPLRERITAAHTVVLGYVETLYPSKETTAIYHSNNTKTLLPRYYTAKIVLTCAFHGKYSKTIQPTFNLTTVNTGSSCHPTTVKKHGSYILLLNGSLAETELAPMEVNHQTAAVGLTEPSMEVIRTEFGYEIIKQRSGKFICQAAAPPDTKLKRMDPAMVIGENKLSDNNAANTITHIGLISLVGAFLISVLF